MSFLAAAAWPRSYSWYPSTRLDLKRQFEKANQPSSPEMMTSPRETPRLMSTGAVHSTLGAPSIFSIAMRLPKPPQDGPGPDRTDRPAVDALGGRAVVAERVDGVARDDD